MLVKRLRNPWLLLLIAISLFYGHRNWSLRELHQPPGVLVTEQPIQQLLDNAEPFRWRDYEIQPLAVYSLTARIIGRRDYRWDSASAISPTDLALGWGPMSDTAVIEQFEFRQSARFVSYRYQGIPPVAQETIDSHLANTHLIPANDVVRGQIDRLRVGQLVSLKGKLVKVRGDNGWYWDSSLSRTDTGDGACELMWVEEIYLQ